MKLNLPILFSILFILASCTDRGATDSVFDDKVQSDGEGLERIVQKLVPAPNVPEHTQVADGGPKIVEVTLEAIEKKIEVAEGDSVWAMTFNGTVPGPLIVVHEGDFVELTLKNPPTNTQLHNIDFHAATGEGGGADLTLVSPGQEVTVRFRATKAGVFVYHCAPGGMMVPLHVVAGMNGAIMVLPRGGLKDENGNSVKYDRAYYVVEQDFYLPTDANGKVKNIATPQESINEMEAALRKLLPTHLVFNGRDGSIRGRNALKASVGEKVLFISAQANRDTRLHLIGGHADLFWPGGKFNNTPWVDLETWAIPGGSGAAALYQFRQPGTYVFLNHNLVEAFALGAIGEVKVEGEFDSTYMKRIRAPH